VKPARHLVSTRRPVPASRRGEYDAGWARVHAEATARGAHAWRFVSAARADLFLEFLEFRSDADPRSAPPLAEALARLEAAFAGEAEEWEEL